MCSRLAGGLLVFWLATVAGFAHQSPAGTPQLVSKRNPAASQPAGGNGYSTAPTVTPDGRFVMFVSTANNLTPGDNSQVGTDVFVRDRLLATTTLVSVNLNGTGGGNGNSMADMISADGRFVLFESDASDLVLGDTNGVTDIFLRDLLAGTTTLVSVAMDVSPANGVSSYAVMTPDGRYVAFLSLASNLVTNDFNGIQDVFVRDMDAGTTVLASVGANGASTNIMDMPVITPDGRYVAFFSTATGLVPGMTQFPGDVFLRDLVGGTTTWISTNLPATRPATAAATHPILSADGRYVAFKCLTNASLLPIFRYDTSLNTRTVVSTNSFAPAVSSDDVSGPEMSADGRYVAYVFPTLISTTNYSSVRIWDGQTATNVLVSQDRFGGFPSNTFSDTPVISPNGQYVAFVSTATNLVTNAISAGSHVYLRDMQAGATYLADMDTNGAGSVNCAGAVPSLSSDGRYVAFAALDGGLVALDNNAAYDVFLRDRTNAVTEMESVRNPSVQQQSGAAISLVSQSSLSPDGRRVVFASRSDDLVTNDFNGDSDIYMADLLSGSNILVSVATNGNSGLGGASTSPVMSVDGRFVVFVSAATNLVTNDTITANKIFYRDLQAPTNILASANSNGLVLGNGDCAMPAISQNGRYVVFLCKTNVTLATTATFWRDMVSGNTALLSASSATANGPAISGDGRYAAYYDANGHIFVWDSQTGLNVYGNTFSGTAGAFFAPTGTKLLFQTLGTASVVDFVSNTTLLTFPSTIPVKSPTQWSSDGRFVAVVSSSVFFTGSPFTNQVFLCDLQTTTITLVSANSNRTSSANAGADMPALSGDGRFVTFRSLATDILPGISNAPNLFVFDRLTGSNSLLTAGPLGSSWSPWVSKPSTSSNGLVIAFQSLRPGLDPGSLDLNRVSDVFAEPQSPWATFSTVGDGIPDAWRAEFFGGDGTTTNSLSCATCDADGDGMSNLQEYQAGTDPGNPASVLQLLISPLVAGNNVVLTWPTVPGKSYQVQFKNNLTDASWSIQSGNALIIGYQGSVTVPAAQFSRYYRIVAVN